MKYQVYSEYEDGKEIKRTVETTIETEHQEITITVGYSPTQGWEQPHLSSGYGSVTAFEWLEISEIIREWYDTPEVAWKKVGGRL